MKSSGIRFNLRKWFLTPYIDAECHLQDINLDLINQITMLAPFGCENPEPILCVRNIKVSSPVVVGNNHLKMRLTSNGAS